MVEADRLANQRLQEDISSGYLENKLCFAYCGEDRCNCAAGKYWQYYMEELRKLESAAINTSEGEKHLL